MSTPTHRRNVATELAALELLATERGVDLTFHRRREPVPHWAVEALSGLTQPVIPTVTEVHFLDAVTKMGAALSEPPTKRPAALPEADPKLIGKV